MATNNLDTFWTMTVHSTTASTAALTDMEATYNAVTTGGTQMATGIIEEHEEALAPKDFDGGDLMELVKVCSEAESKGGKISNEAISVSAKLKELGFAKAHAQIHGRVDLHERLERIAEYGYIKIEDKNITKFLEAKVKTYNDACPTKKKKKKDSNVGMYNWVNAYSSIMIAGIDSDMSTRGLVSFGGVDTPPMTKHYTAITRDTCHRQSTKEGTIGMFAWKETDIKEYDGIPPLNVLEVFEEHKKRDLFHDFSVAEVEGVHDPLLLGRLEGRSERYFISQWGDDIQLDDLL